jgi:hypothetical protein
MNPISHWEPPLAWSKMPIGEARTLYGFDGEVTKWRLRRAWPRMFYEHTLYSLRPSPEIGVILLLLLLETETVSRESFDYNR